MVVLPFVNRISYRATERVRSHIIQIRFNVSIPGSKQKQTWNPIHLGIMNVESNPAGLVSCREWAVAVGICTDTKKIPTAAVYGMV